MLIAKNIDDGKFPLRSCSDPELGIARMLLMMMLNAGSATAAAAVSTPDEIEMRADRPTRKNR
ncbi:exported protein of unknown function [Nitrososphaera viennensis EN76]|uniref:Uncharacterized protein n=1 Tax=Nitrososphaera viennensis EN76 TaxID=926571 RepID=A0A060HQL2_9ARCH|nr:exported protein of unknown function [Nitrososphaera viennensis EN76]